MVKIAVDKMLTIRFQSRKTIPGKIGIGLIINPESIRKIFTKLQIVSFNI